MPARAPTRKQLRDPPTELFNASDCGVGPRHTGACADFFCAEGGVKFTGGRVDDFVKLSKAPNKLIHGRSCVLQPNADVFAPNRTGVLRL